MPDNLVDLIHLADDLRRYKQLGVGTEGESDLEGFLSGMEPNRQSRLLSALANVDIMEGMRKGQDPFPLIAGSLLPPGGRLETPGQVGRGLGLPVSDRRGGEGVRGAGGPPRVEDFLGSGQGGQGGTGGDGGITNQPQSGGNTGGQAFTEPTEFPFFPTTRQEAVAFIKHGVPEDIAPYTYNSDPNSPFFGWVTDINNKRVTDPKIIAKVRTFDGFSKAAHELALRAETQLPRSEVERGQEAGLAGFEAASGVYKTTLEAGFRKGEIELQDRLISYRDETQRRFLTAENARDRAIKEGELEEARKQHGETQKLSQLSLLLNFLSALGSQPQLLYTLGQGGVIGKLGEAVGFDLSSLVPPQTGQTQLPSPEQFDQMSPIEKQRLLSRIASQTGMSPEQIMAEIQRQAPAGGGIPGRVTRG